MKLIVSELNALERYISREFYYVMTELIQNHGWQQIDTWQLRNARVSIEDSLMAALGELPDTILFWECFDLLPARAAEIYRLNCRKVIFADDLHWWNESMRQRKLISFVMCDIVLSPYAYLWTRHFPELRDTSKVRWIPHAASPDFMLAFNQHPENMLLLSGAINQHYPMRQQLQRLHLQYRDAISYHAHPGYHCQYDHVGQAAVGCGYAALINKYRAGFTDSLTFNYLVAKYFEIPATGALLCADRAVSSQLTQLGFNENEHYLPVTHETLEAQIRFVRDEANHAALDRIRRNGQELVWQKHKTSDRARSINEVCV